MVEWAENTASLIMAIYKQLKTGLQSYLDIAEWYALLISIGFHSYQEIFIVRILATSCVEVTSSIIRPISTKIVFMYAIIIILNC